MERKWFHEQLRDLLTKIHDLPALEKHPLTPFISSTDAEGNRALEVRGVVHDAIDQLEPESGPPRIDTIEWRYFLILQGRYVQGLTNLELQHQLAIGERQLRRLHFRSLEALENLIWARINISEADPGLVSREPKTQAYPVSVQAHDLHRIVAEVVDLCKPRASAQKLSLDVKFSSELPMVNTDRVLIRQVLLAMISLLMASDPMECILITVTPEGNRVSLAVSSSCTPQMVKHVSNLLDEKVDPFWLQQLRASLQFIDEPMGQSASGCSLCLLIPTAPVRSILVIDDQEPAIRMIQRFLTGSSLMVEGTTKPQEILQRVRANQPAGVLLDVMMPGVDGWEVLQMVKSDPETSHIPVIICSVWDEPQMALSLGANGYLKKPFTQGELIAVLQNAGVMDKQDGRSQEGSG